MDNDWASLHKSGMTSFFKTATFTRDEPKRWTTSKICGHLSRMKRILVTSNATTTYRDYVKDTVILIDRYHYPRQKEF
jgi:hypothetical protein